MLPYPREFLVSKMTSHAIGAILSDLLPEILNIIGHSHSGKITHDISHYFEVEESDVGSQQRFNNSKILKSSTLEQVMSSDHPPFKRDDGLRAAVAEAFPKLLEPVDDTQDSFVYLGHAILQTLGALFVRSDLRKPEQKLGRGSRMESPLFVKEWSSGIPLPGN